MRSEKALITVGILGSYENRNVQGSVNSYVIQKDVDYELIFSLDKKYCTPIGLLHQTFFAQGFDMGSRVSILEKQDMGILAHAQEIIQCAKGKHLLFVSIEDFLYQADALNRMIRAIKYDHAVYVFHALLRGVSICYPTKILKQICFTNISRCGGINMLHRILRKELKKKKVVYIHEEGRVIDRSIKKYLIKWNGYYCDDKKMETRILRNVAQMSRGIHADRGKLSSSHRYALIKMSECPKNEIRKELCYRYCQGRHSMWGISESSKQYLKTLLYFYKYESRRADEKERLLKRKKKIKMVFFAMEYAVWPSFKSVYELALKDERFIAQLVYVPFSHTYSSIDHEQELLNYKSHGYDIIAARDYDLLKEVPDIAVYLKPYDSIPEKYQIQQVRKIVSVTVYIPYAMEMGISNGDIHCQCHGIVQYYADHILAFAPDYYEKCKNNTLRKGENYLTIGHPRIDLKYEKQYTDAGFANKILLKAGARKIILWNSHFTLDDGFLQFGSKILQYIQTHMERFFLWRPHPLFYRSLAERRGCSVEEIFEWMEKYDTWDNLMIDRSASYLTAFQVSNAMVTDYASFIPEYIAYEKPFLVTHKYELTPEQMLHGNMDVVNHVEDLDAALDLLCQEHKAEEIERRLQCLFSPKTTVAEELLNILDQNIREGK